MRQSMNHDVGGRHWGHSNQVSVICAYRITHLITIIPASQLHFLAYKNAQLPGGSQQAA